MVAVTLRPNLWFDWTQIAIRAEARAIAARKSGLADFEAGSDAVVQVENEMHETMIAVASARSAFSHLEADWKEHGYFRGVSRAQIPIEATSDPPSQVDHWLAEIKRLIDDRGELAHHPQPSSAPVPHDMYPMNVSPLVAYYVAERATSAVDLLLDFYHRVIDSPSDRLAPWAEKRRHIPAVLDEIRTNAHSLL